MPAFFEMFTLINIQIKHLIWPNRSLWAGHFSTSSQGKYEAFSEWSWQEVFKGLSTENEANLSLTCLKSCGERNVHPAAFKMRAYLKAK